MVKFVNHAMHEIGPFRILDTNIRDYDTDESITEGDKVTIKIPDDIEVSKNLRNSMIFLMSYKKKLKKPTIEVVEDHMRARLIPDLPYLTILPYYPQNGDIALIFI